MTFADIGLSDKLLKAIEDSGYTQPTPIQEKAIPYVLMGRDILGCAQTGTGKTASFALPMIDILAEGRAKARMPRSLIIAPTRELAAQVAENFDRYGKHHKLTTALLIGGSSFVEQEQKLDRGVDVLIATPGRLLDLFDRGKILLADTRLLVIDEADRMLDMGFMPDVERIVSVLPKIRQTVMFSATMPKEIRRLADKFLLNPKEVSVAPPASPAETVEQGLIRCPGADKRKALSALLEREEVQAGLIFCNRKRDISALAKALVKQGRPIAELHGDMSQPARTETLERFRAGEINLLVCSDVAARGLDIPKVSHVFNYDVPMNADDYIHRIGRTGRAGRSGRAYTIATPADGKYLAAIESMLGKNLPPVQLEPVRSLPREDVQAETQAETGVERKDDGSRDDGAKARRQSGRRRAGARKQSEEVTAEGAAAPNAASENTAPENAAPENAASEMEVPSAANDDADGADTGRHAEAEPQKAKNSRRGKAARGKAERQNAGPPERQQTSNGYKSKPFGDHTPAFLLRRTPLSASA